MSEKNKKEKESNAMSRWYRETMGELHKVTWPTPQEAWRLTKVVLITMVMVSLILGALDFAFTRIIAFILS